MVPLLISAFAPFPGVAENPTETLLRSLPGCGDPVLAHAHHVVLPTEYDAAPRALQAAIDAVPDTGPAAIVMLGYSGSASGFVLETRSTSACLTNRPDAAGHCPPAETSPTQTIECPLDLAGICADLRAAGLPALLSDDAGSYVCNHVYHAALSGPCARPDGPVGLFVHLPALTGTELARSAATSLPLAAMQRGLGIVARSVLDR